MHPCGGCGQNIESVLLSKYKREIDVEYNGVPHHCPSLFSVEQHLSRIGDALLKIQRSVARIALRHHK